MPLSYHLGVVLSVTSLASCVPPTSAERTFPIVFVVEADPGVRIGATSVFIDGDHVGDSDSNGLVRATVHGESGRRLRVQHDCPDGHEAPSPRKTLRLREYEGLGSSDRVAMEITLRCVPTQRFTAFVVRAKNGADLPVLLNGEEVARTNGSGVAHFSVRGVPGKDYKVELDARGRPSLQPSLAMHLFTQPDANDILVINQSFEVKTDPRPRAIRRARITRIE